MNRNIFAKEMVCILIVLTLVFGVINVVSLKDNNVALGEVDGFVDNPKFDISPEQAYGMLGVEGVFLDVRSNREYAKGHIKNAISMPLPEILSSCFPPAGIEGCMDKKVIVYCDSETRSKVASCILRLEGFHEVYRLKGGLDAWIKLGFPVSYERADGHFCNCDEESTEFDFRDFVHVYKKDAVEELTRIREALLENKGSWVAGYTSVAKSGLYFDGKGLGWIEEEVDEYERVSYDGVLPDEFDWRDVNGTDWTTPIKDQGRCGSCVAFGVLAALETIVQVSVGQPFNCDLSEAHLFFCGGGGCSRGWVFSEAKRYLKDHGVPDELCFPYTPYDTPCRQSDSNWRQRVVRISKTGYVYPYAEDIQSALLKYGPLVTGMKVYRDFFYYRGGVYEHLSGRMVGLHAVTIVGYNDTDGYWICKNSWGRDWGENGWFRIKYGECHIELNTIYFSGVYGNIQPFPPRNPFPYDGMENLETEIDFSWDPCYDPDGDVVYYNVYLAESRRPGDDDLVAERLTVPSFHLDGLKGNRSYYWKVIAEDEHGSKHESPVWKFATRVPDDRPPEVKILDPSEGYLYWKSYKIPIFSDYAVVVGVTDVNVLAYDALSEVSHVEFYFDDVLCFTDREEPYTWRLNKVSFGTVSLLKVVAYDTVGNSAFDEIKVRVFNF
jgi:C1A family cysteine protease/rhodanese-related sulfurtransferase